MVHSHPSSGVVHSCQKIIVNTVAEIMNNKSDSLDIALKKLSTNENAIF